MSFFVYTSSLPELRHTMEKTKAIPVIDRGGPYVCETSRLPHFLDQWSSIRGTRTPGLRIDILEGMRKHLTGYVKFKKKSIS
jgi:hypothetical protein